MRWKALPVVLAALAVAGLSTPAHAKRQTSRMTARVKLLPSCKMQVTDLLFGRVNGTSVQVDAQTPIIVTCGPEISYAITIDNGQNFTTGTRRMRNGGSNGQGIPQYVPYTLFRNSARTLAWGNTPLTTFYGNSGSGGSVNIPIYGRVTNAKVFARVYTDIVTITIFY